MGELVPGEDDAHIKNQMLRGVITELNEDGTFKYKANTSDAIEQDGQLQGVGGGGLNQAAVDARVQAGVSDWAETDNNTDIPADKLGNQRFSTSDETKLDAITNTGSGVIISGTERTKLTNIEDNAKDDQTITAGTGLSGGGTGDVTLNVDRPLAPDSVQPADLEADDVGQQGNFLDRLGLSDDYYNQVTHVNFRTGTNVATRLQHVTDSEPAPNAGTAYVDLPARTGFNSVSFDLATWSALQTVVDGTQQTGDNSITLQLTNQSTTINVYIGRFNDATHPFMVGTGEITEEDIRIRSIRNAKLDGIEPNATADQTGAEIATALDNAIGSAWRSGGGGNGGTDGVVSGANYTASSRQLRLTRTNSLANLDVTFPLATTTADGMMHNVDKSKLDNIQANSSYVNTIRYTANNRTIALNQPGRTNITTTLPLANGTRAGLMSSADKTKLNAYPDEPETSEVADPEYDTLASNVDILTGTAGDTFGSHGEVWRYTNSTGETKHYIIGVNLNPEANVAGVGGGDRMSVDTRIRVMNSANVEQQEIISHGYLYVRNASGTPSYTEISKHGGNYFAVPCKLNNGDYLLVEARAAIQNWESGDAVRFDSTQQNFNVQELT